MVLSDQELCVALKEFERTMVGVSDLFLSLLENRLDDYNCWIRSACVVWR